MPRQVTPLAGVILAPNPSPMTLDGTNTWILRAPDEHGSVVVDPGPDIPAHLDAIRAAGPVSLILLTHGHPDHSDAARPLHDLTGAPVRALDPVHRYGGEGLRGGDVIGAAGVDLTVIATPGHTSDSLSFLLHGGGGNGPDSGDAVLTGDTVLGRGTTVVAHPDGRLDDYLASLRTLAGLTGTAVLPGHGPELPAASEAAQAYLAHRQVRLDQIRAALAAGDTTAMDVVRRVYADVDPAVWPFAELSVLAQLDYLRDHPGR